MKNYEHISHNHYYVTDTEASRLARPHKLPRHGHQLKVVLDDGKSAWLTRTPLTYFVGKNGRNTAPKRGWVWAVFW